MAPARVSPSAIQASCPRLCVDRVSPVADIVIEGVESTLLHLRISATSFSTLRTSIVVVAALLAAALLAAAAVVVIVIIAVAPDLLSHAGEGVGRRTPVGSAQMFAFLLRGVLDGSRQLLVFPAALEAAGAQAGATVQRLRKRRRRESGPAAHRHPDGAENETDREHVPEREGARRRRDERVAD